MNMFLSDSIKRLVSLFLAVFLVYSCDKNSDDNDDQVDCPISTCGSTEDVAVFKFIFFGDTDTLFFSAATTDETVIQIADEALKKPLQERLAHIHGHLSPGECAYNSDYDWHFTLNEWDLAEASVEWCDAFPANPDSTGLEVVCPWSSRVYERVH